MCTNLLAIFGESTALVLCFIIGPILFLMAVFAIQDYGLEQLAKYRAGHTRKQTLKISDDGSTLTIEGKGYSTQYNRTTPGPPKGG